MGLVDRMQRWIFCLVQPLLWLVLPSAGCVSASLATNTGSTIDGRAWSMDAVQKAHVGEEVAFDFVLTDATGAFVNPTGVADYVVATIGADRHEVEPDLGGHFVFTHRFKGVRPGERVRVTADAYRERGRRDFVLAMGRNPEVGRWIASERAGDEPDQRIVSDSVDLEFYQAVVDMPVDGTGDDLDLETGVMRLRKLDGRVVAVYAGRPGRPGFELNERAASGGFRVTFQPEASMLNSSGFTDVEFSIRDRVGRRLSASTQLPTP